MSKKAPTIARVTPVKGKKNFILETTLQTRPQGNIPGHDNNHMLCQKYH